MDLKTTAVEELTKLADTAFKPETIDQQFDYMKLLGYVLGQQALLEVATMPITDKGDAAAKVSAARALLHGRETPESVAERLRRSLFAGLTVKQLEYIVQQVKEGNTDIPSIVAKLREEGASR